jgi:hypothetical protein
MMVGGQHEASGVLEDYLYERAWSMAKRLGMQLTQVVAKEVEMPIEEVRKVKAQFVAAIKELN